jgi:hypothetical protein
MDSMPERRDREEAGNAERRIKRNIPLFKTGMISTIRHARIATKNIGIAMRRSGKLESGRTDYTRIGKLANLSATETVTMRMIIVLR